MRNERQKELIEELMLSATNLDDIGLMADAEFIRQAVAEIDRLIIENNKIKYRKENGQ